jgi:uncharacterized phage-associated protein
LIRLNFGRLSLAHDPPSTAMTESALAFAEAVLRTSRAGLTPLKLQKLLFYCYGAARAHDEAVPHILFERWQHGPVSPAVYEQFKHYGSTPIPRPEWGEGLVGAALDAFCVYDCLSAWQLREESHLEAPWRAGAPDCGTIDDKLIVDHFRRKFLGGAVAAPVYLPGSWSLAVDGLPGLRAPTLRELARLLTH